MLQFKSGNICLDRSEALVNTVNCEGVSGAGIAEQFKEVFPDNYESYRLYCQKGKLKPGHLCVYVIPNLASVSSTPRAIFNVATKNRWKNASQMAWVKSGINEIAHFMEIFRYKSVAIPALGCGNGGLNWNTVRGLIVNRFIQEDYLTTIYEPRN